MATNRKINVLIYSGPGSTTDSVRHATWSLRRLLGPHYAVLTITADQLLKEPWTTSCALLVMPGGADMGYCRILNGEGNRRIKQYVQMGGKYLGLCAGGYYGCGRCEWEVGKKGMEVVGERELGFFPGTCRGLAFEGFVYHSEAGARAVGLDVCKETLAAGGGAVPGRFRTYYNGGGVFVDAENLSGRSVEVLARYVDPVACEGGDAAVVYCKVGEGGVLLTGPHPEFSGHNLNTLEPSGHQDYPAVVAALKEDEKQRVDFMKACLIKLGLEVNQETEGTPSLSRLHISSARYGGVSELLQSWQEADIISKEEDGREIIKGENDAFILEQHGRFAMGNVKDALPAAEEDKSEYQQPPKQQGDMLIDYNALPKHLVPHETALPDTKETPYFNHHAFYANLKDYNAQPEHRESEHTFGTNLLYGEVVTSTSTLLEKNPTLLNNLPTGFTATATTQIAARGRGTNAWVSPPGQLMFSTVLRHSLALSNSAPVVFIQYLAGLAIVSAIQAYEPSNSSYKKLPVKLKWPNDIYALDPTVPDGESEKYIKIGGILVNSSYSGGDYTLVLGIGLNVANAAPTTSLSLLAKKLGLPPLTVEKLLAGVLTQIESLYTRFCRTGWDTVFEDMYLRSWLHSEQIVTLENEGGVRARIKGITRDWGLLVAEELGWEDRELGKKWVLQSDSNSFDFLKGLVRRKI
ncbi:putative biotin apo-protein ligase [Hortaea werneckii]|nr:putative biotin apo-protein ligase [Hortaea werneckii]KAI7588926.1 putative biotin apo-protein ligase [Hortaea werneckii]